MLRADENGQKINIKHIAVKLEDAQLKKGTKPLIFYYLAKHFLQNITQKTLRGY